MEKLPELNLEKSSPYGKNVDKDFNVFMSFCRKHIANPDEALLKKAYYFMIEAHKGMSRASGEHYYTHPLKVAISMMEDFSINEENVICAALLHDAVEDNYTIKLELIEKEFNKDIARLVDGVTKIRGKETTGLDKAATYGKLFMAMVQDPRAILVKLADRYDNMRTLEHLDYEKIYRIGNETLNFYVPFAQRLKH